MKKINVLHLMTAFTIGGAEKVVLDLILNLDKKTFDASIIALSNNSDMLGEYLSHNINAEKLDMGKNVSSFFHALKYLDNYISEHEVDIVHVHLFHPLVFIPFLKLKHPKLKVVFTSHNTDIGGKLREVFTYLIKPFRSKDIVFSANMITTIYKKNTAVIANGIDIGKFQKYIPRKTPFTFLSVGTVRTQKNQIFLIKCAQQLKAKGYDFVIDIVGGGAENKALIETIQQEIVNQGVEDCVRMLGARNDIPHLLKTAHCIVLPSHHEGLPIVLLEAGAAKLPIISTPVGAIPTLIDDSNGYLASLDNFFDTMDTVYNNYQQAEEKAQRLVKKIEMYYSIESMVAAHGKLYQSLVSPADALEDMTNYT